MSVSELIKFIEFSAKNPSSVQLVKIQQFARKLTKEINDIPEGYSYTACHAAVKAGDFAALEILVLEGQADLGVTDKEGKKPKDYVQNVEFIIKMAALKAEQYRRQQSDGMHLHDLIRLGKKSLIKARIASHPQEINDITYLQRNAGHIAALYYPKCMKWLVASGLDLRARDNMGDSCLSFVERDKACRKMLVERYASLFLSGIEESQQLHLLSTLLEGMKIADNQRQRRGSVSSLRRSLSRSHSSRAITVSMPEAEEVSVTLSLSEIMRQDSLSQFRAYVRENKPSRQELVSLAIQSESVRILVWLLEHGELLPSAEESNVLSKMSKEQAAFWFAVIARIEKLHSRRKDDELQKRFEKEEVLFNRLLIEHGLTKPLLPYQCASFSPYELDQISQQSDCQTSLMVALYEMCSGIASDRDNPQFNVLQLNHMALGLLNLHASKDIFKTLTVLATHLAPLQKLVALYIAKQLLCNDHHGKSYLSKRVSMQTLNSLFDALKFEHGQEFIDALLTMAEVKRKMHNPLISASINIQSALAECGYRIHEHTDEIHHCADVPKFYGPHQLAQDCRAISLSFYQRVNSTEFGDKLWQKTAKHQTSPNIVNSQKLFDNLQQFIIIEILKQKSFERRVDYISRLIETIELLLDDSEMPDINSAMAILSALNARAVCRLKATFAGLSPNVAAKLTRFKETLDNANNYRGIRQLMREKPKCLPFLGIYLKDFNAIGENQHLTDITERMGVGFQELISRQSVLFNVRIQSSIGLLPRLQSWKTLDDDEIFILSHRIEAGVVFLEDDGQLESVADYLQAYTQTQFPLRVHYKNKITEGPQAVETLFAWLRDFVIREVKTAESDLNHFIELIQKLKQNDPEQRTFSEQHLAFTVWYASYQTMALVPQFSRLSVTDPVGDEPIQTSAIKKKLSVSE